MEMSNIIFNICIPVYKAEDFLQECVQSVLIQNHTHFRIVLVDDGSPDRSGEICDQLASADDRIFVIHQTNQGQIIARQAAIQLVQSMIPPEEFDRNYILFLDSDDTLKEFALEKIAHHICQTECDMFIYGMDWVQDGNIVGEFRGKKKPFVGTVTDKALLFQIVLGDMCYNSLCRKVVSITLTVGKDSSQYGHIRHGEDLLQSLDYLKDSKKTVFIKESLYNYRINPDSITHTEADETFQIDSTVRSTVLKFLKEENVWDQEKFNQYYQYCAYLLFQEVLDIVRFPIPSAAKKKLFDQILADPYYQKILTCAGNRNWVLCHLKKKKYNSVMMLSHIYVYARMLRKKLR